MRIKKALFFFLILALLILSYLVYTEVYKEERSESISENINEMILNENTFSSNTIKDVNYISRDTKGNEYIIYASTGEIDINNPDIIYLTDVKAFINLANSNTVNISSDFGKYNTKNFDTIFSKNVIVKYLENKITGEYLDFSLESNLMVISRDIVYTNLDNVLVADVLEMNIETKDTKIYMYENKKKINIKNKNWNGHNKKV